jgi:hypothetical protein
MSSQFKQEKDLKVRAYNAWYKQGKDDTLKVVKEAIDKEFGSLPIPCNTPQDVGWTCNKGHLCDDCHHKKNLLYEIGGKKWIINI